MKHSKIWRFVLVLLPLIAAGMEGFPGSVRFFSAANGGEIQICSFYQLVPDCNFAILMPLTAILTVALMVVSLIFSINLKNKLLSAMQWLSIGAIFTSAVPNVINSDPKVLPFVLVPILLLVDCLLVIHVKKNPLQQDAGKGDGGRLDRHI